jgi:hypothetical protein
MTDRERQFANIGLHYAEGIDRANVIILPSGRKIRRTKKGKWRCQPPKDNYWREFDDLLEAATFAMLGYTQT